MRQPAFFRVNLWVIGTFLAATWCPQAGADYTITTMAGGGSVRDGGPAVEAQLFSPDGLAVDGAGNLYIADRGNHRIRRVNTSGIITTIAGTGDAGDSGEGGPAVEAQLFSPDGLAVDSAGNLYIADTVNHRVRRVDANGTITTIAGTGERGYSGDGGPAVRALLSWPEGVAVDSAGNLHIADTNNHCIRRMDAAGIITTIAGTGIIGYSEDGGPAVDAQLSRPEGVAVDSAGNLYIADTANHRIRRVGANGIISTIAGTDQRGYAGDGGPAVQAVLSWPQGVAVDSAGSLYIADTSNHRIRRVNANGIITSIAGTGQVAYTADGGLAVLAQLVEPEDVATDGAGKLYIADRRSHRIRRVDAAGTIATIAGTGRAGYSGDGGPAVEAQLALPKGVAADGVGNIYIADSFFPRIRRVDANGSITTIAGIGRTGFSGDGGLAIEARLRSPYGVAVDGAGNLYIADRDNHRIRRVDAGGTITTTAGSGKLGRNEVILGDGGPAVEAHLSWPEGVAVDSSGNLYIADAGNHRIRRVDATGTIATIAGTGRAGYSGDGGPPIKAQLFAPLDVAVDGARNLYISDSGNHRIRRVDADGIITTIAGTGEPGYSGDGGSAVAAQLYSPRGIVVEGTGDLYFADAGNRRIRKVSLPRSITLQAPTGLTAMPVSPSQIDLVWRDNSTNETGFRIQRREEGADEWSEAGTTVVNTTSYSDMGLLPGTAYRYRVQAFNDAASSAFSSEAMATTHAQPPPTLTHFTPGSGPMGTRVTLTGTGLLRATDVLFNGVSSLRFEVVSMTSIQAIVPPGATSGPITVVTPEGTAVSRDPFTVTAGETGSRLFVPVLLTSAGRGNSFFTSELTLSNRGAEEGILHYTYTARSGGGSGTATDRLAPGHQRIHSDAISYLAGLGIPIPSSGNRIGTLRVEVSGPSELSVTTRTTTAVPDGRAGLAYPGVPVAEGFQEAVYLCGLRQNRQDRSNVAFQNMGGAEEGAITLRTTVYSGEASDVTARVLEDVKLKPGGFHQYNQVLNVLGSNATGYVKVERVEGEAPFYAYGVINDNFNSDGSFVFPLTESSLVRTSGQTLPVVIETGNFQSELTVTNFSASDKQVDFSFVADAVDTGDDTASFSLKLKAGQQTILPDLVSWMRQEDVDGIGRADRVFVGALFATVSERDLSGIVIGARTGSPDKRGGQYSLFYNGVPYGSASVESTWIYGLQQNAENRSNLALVNTGEIDDTPSSFEITIYDGSGESRPRRKNVTLGPRRWTQENGILGKISQGYVQIRKTSGNNPFVAYGVINDGGKPGERTGDGAFVLSQ